MTLKDTKSCLALFKLRSLFLLPTFHLSCIRFAALLCRKTTRTGCHFDYLEKIGQVRVRFAQDGSRSNIYTFQAYTCCLHQYWKKTVTFKYLFYSIIFFYNSLLYRLQKYIYTENRRTDSQTDGQWSLRVQNYPLVP